MVYSLIEVLCKRTSYGELQNIAWNLFSLQLSNDTEITATHLFNSVDGTIEDDSALISSSSGTKEYHDLHVEALSGIVYLFVSFLATI
jgi:hypothetical protein